MWDRCNDGSFKIPMSTCSFIQWQMLCQSYSTATFKIIVNIRKVRMLSLKMNRVRSEWISDIETEFGKIGVSKSFNQSKKFVWFKHNMTHVLPVPSFSDKCCVKAAHYGSQNRSADKPYGWQIVRTVDKPYGDKLYGLISLGQTVRMTNRTDCLD